MLSWIPSALWISGKVLIFFAVALLSAMGVLIILVGLATGICRGVSALHHRLSRRVDGTGASEEGCLEAAREDATELTASASSSVGARGEDAVEE